MIIQFLLRFHSEFGQRFFISGNIDALGGGVESDAVSMEYLDPQHWHLEVEVPDGVGDIRYKYFFQDVDGSVQQEWLPGRTLEPGAFSVAALRVLDFWNYPGDEKNVYYTQPFQNILFPTRVAIPYPSKLKGANYLFRVKMPLLPEGQGVCLLGEGPDLGRWEKEEILPLRRKGEGYEIGLALSDFSHPLSYKYGLFEESTGRLIRLEEGPDRALPPPEADTLTILHDEFVRLPVPPFRGAGVAIPVFSLRTGSGLGVGEFCDLPALVDWCVEVGMNLIQLLPINDTNSTLTWTDSYPYAPISVFALHPIYLNLEKVAGSEEAELLELLDDIKVELNRLPAVDYEAVITEKLAALQRLYQAQKASWLIDPDYRAFLERNRHWLMPYAAFCRLRDEYGTADYSQWGPYREYDPDQIAPWFDPGHELFDEVAVHLYTQYHLHRQLREAVDYAHEKGIVLKGDLPIGIYRYSCDAWVAPGLYNMNAQAGAPPDDFAVKGQNWGFPTYDWPRMEADGFAWWKERFSKLSEYFDAFRIDHILGFFRIWSIPLHAVEGIMGRFDPCIPVVLKEFGDWGIPFDRQRFTEPFITQELVESLFGESAGFATDTYLQYLGEGRFALKEAYDTQRKVLNRLSGQPQEERWIQPLFDLISNVLLFPDEADPEGAFHFRIRMEDTYSFQSLDPHLRHQLRELYINYFYRRQDAFWREEALRKLPAIKSATRMLICGEDLGMVPDSVPGVMKDLGFLSLEIQRMPKDPGRRFFHPDDAPYLSVVTPSTHDMSTIRGWWEEDREAIQWFFNHELGEPGQAPASCEGWINQAILLQHLHSPAMWSIFQLQDLMGMDEALRREHYEQERINIPANPKHYWRYRMHITLEELMRQSIFNENLGNMLQESGRGRVGLVRGEKVV